jgi:hypothetical protein
MASRVGTPVKTSAQGTNSSGLDNEAIALAFEAISRTDVPPLRPKDREFTDTRPASLSSVSPDVASLERRLAFGKVAVTSLIGLLAIVSLFAIVFAWPSSGGRSAKSDPILPANAPASISAAADEKQPVTTQATPAIATAKIKSSEPKVQPSIVQEPVGPTGSVPSDAAQRIQTLERRLINLEQGIEQVKNDQAKLARENSALLGGLREAQEKFTLRVQEFVSDAKAAEERAARDRLTAAEQLKGNQEQLAKIGEQLKASQEQIDRLKAAPPRRMTKLVPPQPQPSNTPSTIKPAPQPPSQHARVPPTQTVRPPQTR